MHTACATASDDPGPGTAAPRSQQRPSARALVRTVSRVVPRDTRLHTPSISFRRLPPNSAITGYATEGALFISVHLSTDAVSILRKVWVLINYDGVGLNVHGCRSDIFRLKKSLLFIDIQSIQMKIFLGHMGSELKNNRDNRC